MTVSGFSGGGVFGPQFHVGFSSSFVGAAFWSGGPPLCWVSLFSQLKTMNIVLFPFFGGYCQARIFFKIE